MTALTEKCQAKSVHSCGQCSVSENEVKAMIEIVKEACINAVLDSNYPPGGDAIKAIKGVK